jgi:hypothetical protein
MTNVHEQNGEDKQGDQGGQPGQNEHNPDAQHRSEQGDPFVVIAKSGAESLRVVILVTAGWHEIPGEPEDVASKTAKFVIAKAARKKLVMIMEMALRSPEGKLRE